MGESAASEVRDVTAVRLGPGLGPKHEVEGIGKEVRRFVVAEEEGVDGEESDLGEMEAFPVEADEVVMHPTGFGGEGGRRWSAAGRRAADPGRVGRPQHTGTDDGGVRRVLVQRNVSFGPDAADVAR